MDAARRLLAACASEAQAKPLRRALRRLPARDLEALLFFERGAAHLDLKSRDRILPEFRYRK